MAVLPNIVYNFNENNATTIRDYSENGKDGTGTGLTISASSRVGNDAVFNASTDQIDLGNITDLNGLSSCSIHFGINISAGSSTKTVLRKGGQIRLTYDYSGNAYTFSLVVASGTATVMSDSLVVGTFYDFDVRYESNILELFIDGVSVDTDETQSGNIISDASDLLIGDSGASDSANFLLNEFKLYDSAITSNIIGAVINQQNGILSDNSIDVTFNVGDVIVADYDSTPLYGVVSFIGSGSDFRFLPLTDGISSSKSFRRGGHLWDTTRQWGLLIDDTPKVCFYDLQTKSSEIFTDAKKTYCLGVDGNSASNLIIVDRKESFPTAISGVITLLDGYSYLLAKDIDLTGDRIETNGIVSIWASSPEVGKLKSTGLSSSSYLITSEYTLSLNNVGLDHVKCISLDATANANQAIDWYGVNFYDCTTDIGTIKNYDNVILNTMGFLNSGGLTFDGTIGTIGISDTIFENSTALTSIILPSTLTVTRRFRVNNSSFVSLSGETALNVSTSATIPDEGYILNNVNFGGGGTYLTGVQSTDNKARFEGCRGVSNSGNIGQYYMQGNSTSTTISTSGTFVKIAGTTSAGSYVEKFDVTTTSNKGVYSGSLTGFYKVEIVAGCTSGNNKELELAIYKNGVITTPSRSKGTTTGSGKAENIVSHDILELSTTDYVEAFITNNTGTTNITVEDLNVTIVRLN